MIRDAAPEDAEAIAAIWRPVIEETTASFRPAAPDATEVGGMIEAARARGHAFLVAGDPPLGFGYYGQLRGNAGYRRTMEHTIVLSDAARGRGLGRALLGALEDHARAGGATSIWGGVSAENAAGLRFHAACGYAEAARLSEVGWKFGRTVDLVLLRKAL